MIERLLRRTAGEVRVRVTGASLPRFLNACTQGGVRLRRMDLWIFSPPSKRWIR